MSLQREPTRRERVILLPDLAQIGRRSCRVALLPLIDDTVPTLVAVAELTISISLGCRGLTFSGSFWPPETMLSRSSSSKSKSFHTGGNSPSRAITCPESSSALVETGSIGVAMPQSPPAWTDSRSIPPPLTLSIVV